MVWSLTWEILGYIQRQWIVFLTGISYTRLSKMFSVFHMGIEKIKQNPQNERERGFCHSRYVETYCSTPFQCKGKQRFLWGLTSYKEQGHASPEVIWNQNTNVVINWLDNNQENSRDKFLEFLWITHQSVQLRYTWGHQKSKGDTCRRIQSNS